MKKTVAILMLSLLVSCKTPDARKPVSQSTDSFIQESIEHNKKLVAFEEGLIREIIENDSVHNYLTSNNGFWYFYNHKVINDTVTPKFGDKVVFTYNILRLDGAPIYTKAELGERTYVIDKQQLFTGLRQGLKLMNAGETVTFLFPSYKAFGYYGDTKRIGTNVPIKSTVTLNSIESAPDSGANNLKHYYQPQNQRK